MFSEILFSSNNPSSSFKIIRFLDSIRLNSPLLDKLFIAPGNAGTGNVGENVNIAVDDFKGIKKFVIENKIRRALVLMGPRRVGKTVMLFHSIQELLTENINPQKIFFIGFIFN